MSFPAFSPRPPPRLLPASTTPQLFTLRVSLDESQPEIWRRLRVNGDIMLPELLAQADTLEATDAELRSFAQPWLRLLELARDGGVQLTQAGYLPPAVCREITDASYLPVGKFVWFS